VLAGGAGGGVAGAAAAEDGEIKMLAHGRVGERLAGCLSRLEGCAGEFKIRADGSESRLHPGESEIWRREAGGF
jgi:hypothetical protein